MNPELLSRDESVLVLIDYQAKLLPAIHEGEKLLKRAELLLFAADTLGIPVIATEQYPKGLGPTVPAIGQCAGFPAPVEKSCFSCAGEPAFMERLAATGRRQVLLAGVETHVCVAQTALELAATGRTVFLAVDACGSRHPLDSQVALRRLESSGIGLTTAEAAVFEWLKRAGTEEFKKISAKVKGGI